MKINFQPLLFFYSEMTSSKRGSSKKSFTVILNPSQIWSIVSILKFLVSFFKKSEIVGRDIPAALDKSQIFVRGGGYGSVSNAGSFTFHYTNGSEYYGYGFRSVLIAL